MKKLKSTNHNSFVRVPDQHYKKPYLVRKIQEQEAEKAIREYYGEETSDLPNPPDIKLGREG
jgi:hypothetical protein